jgi:hypothetical protein
VSTTHTPFQLDFQSTPDGDPIAVIAFYLPPNLDQTNAVEVYTYLIAHLQFRLTAELTSELIQ